MSQGKPVFNGKGSGVGCPGASWHCPTGRDSALRCPRGVQPRNRWFPSLIRLHLFGPLNAARDGAARHPYQTWQCQDAPLV